MKLLKILVLFFALLGSAFADQMVFSKSALLSKTGQEMVVSDGTAWKIPNLIARFCQLGESCPAIVIDGEFKVGDNGVKRSGKFSLTAQQLSGQPLWISAGSKVTIPEGALGVSVQEFTTSFAPEKQKIPVALSFRNSALGNGLVYIFASQSNQPLILYVAIKSVRGEGKTLRVDLPPGGTRELGHLEGWAFNYGDLITITIPGHEEEYEPLSSRI